MERDTHTYMDGEGHTHIHGAKDGERQTHIHGAESGGTDTHTWGSGWRDRHTYMRQRMERDRHTYMGQRMWKPRQTAGLVGVVHQIQAVHKENQWGCTPAHFTRLLKQATKRHHKVPATPQHRDTESLGTGKKTSQQLIY